MAVVSALTDPLNIISIMFDSWRWDAVAHAGVIPVLETPHIDALAADGTRFSNSYCSCALCGPSRMSVATGRYVHTHRARWNDVPLGAGEVVDAQYFNALGYQTALIGKTHFCPPDDHHGYQVYLCQDGRARIDPRNLYPHFLRRSGYTESDILRRDRPAERFEREAESISGNGQYWGYSLPLRVRPEHTESRFVTDLALDYLSRSSREPFFLHLSYLKPHPGWGLSEEYLGRYDQADMPEATRSPAELEQATEFFLGFRRERGGEPFDNDLYRRQVWACYLGLVTELDDMIGRLTTYLEETGLRDRTVIVLTSDHGCFLGDHWMHQTEMFYDCQVRVPLIIVDPRATDTGRDVGALVESVDLLPTLLTAVGADLPAAVQGSSLMHFVDPRRPASAWRAAAHAEWDFRYYQSRIDAGLPKNRSQGLMIRTDRHKYMYFNGLPAQLYDLREDPGELVNIAGRSESRTTEEELREELLRWRMGTDDPVPLLSDEFRLPGSVGD